MESQLFSLSKIFIQRLFRIPDYQRGYAWTEKQYKEFWNDLLLLDESKNHYVGVLTLEDVPKDTVKLWKEDEWIIKSKRYYPYYVVDGQQRLTTSIILIQCITEVIQNDKKLNYTTIDEIRKQYIYESKDGKISRSYLFGYEKDNPSYEFLKKNIFLEDSDNSFPIQETIYTSNLENARIFFLNKLKEMKIEDIEVLYTKLTQNFLFNIYSISSDIDVHVAFETMNNRGKPLSHLELLKNRLIFLSTKFDEDETEKNKLRHAINESWKSIYHYLGKNKNNPLDDDIFLNTHFKIYHSKDVPNDYYQRYEFSSARRTYQTYLLEEKFTSKNIGSSNLSLKEVYSYVKNLKDSVELWYQLLNPSDSSFSKEEKLWLEKLNRTDESKYFLIGLIMKAYQFEKDSKARLRLLITVEKFSFLLSLNSLHLNISVRKLPNLWEVSTFEKIAKELESVIEGVLSNELFLRFLINSFKSRGFYKWDGIKYFLFEYELYIRGNTKSNREKIDWELFCKEDITDFHTVEHIYPRTATKECWKTKFIRYGNHEKKVLKDSLGNLLPLSRPKNSSFQNKCFVDKKGDASNKIGYRYGSLSEIEVANQEDWTAKEILERGLKLLEFMERRWNLKLGNKKDKVKLLNLEFVVKKEKIQI